MTLHTTTARLVTDADITDAERGPGVHVGLWLSTGAPLRCDCGSLDIFSVAPGMDDETLDLLSMRMVVARGVGIKVWCEGCWRGNG